MTTPRIDVVSIFPEYLAPLQLSLVGKARENGLVDIRLHDLRAVTTDRHRTVDDDPLGGGAGMVMRPDVWQRGIEATGEDGDARDLVVLIPTPSGKPLTQQLVSDLARELTDSDVRAVIACGRYEGIDARLVPALADTDRVRRVVEFSLGDYVLNGGEVAALALIEGIVRLLPGVVGNPESLVEESFSQPLLEYPVFTRPAEWDGRAVPDVLLSGHHAAIARWRRDESLRRTALRRPELLRRSEPGVFNAADRAALAEAGVTVGRDGTLIGPTQIRLAMPSDAAAVAELAAVTFPMACPGHVTMSDIRSHVGSELSASRFAEFIADDEHHVLLLVDHDGTAVGYAMVVTGDAARSDAPPGVDIPDGAAELSKVYLLSRAQGTGLARGLMEAALEVARGVGAPALWVATNVENVGAQRRYAKHGFDEVGSRTFRVGEDDHCDLVMLAQL